MEKTNRKITWAHVKYKANSDIEVIWSTDIWREGKYIGKHTRICNILRSNWTRITRLVYIANNRAGMKYILPAYDGWSVCWEVIYS